MENIMINESKKVDKFGVLNTNKNQGGELNTLTTKSKNTLIDRANNELQAKDAIIQNLLKEVGRLTVENGKLKVELEVLHNETSNGIEINNLSQKDEYDEELMGKGYVEMGEINLELSKTQL